MRYSSAMLDFLREGYRRLGVRELTAAFNAQFNVEASASAIRSTLKRHRFRAGRRTGAILRGQYRLVTRAQAQWLTEQYRTLALPALVAAFNAEHGTELSQAQIRGFVRNHRLRSGRTGRFEPGGTSWNTGTVGLMKPNRGSFQPGQQPANLRPLGSERICSKDGYILVKVAETDPATGAAGRYRHKHRVTWEAANGAVPPGHVVAFVDGDRLNCTLANLELIPQAELSRRNNLQLGDYPSELKPSIKLIARLQTRTAARRTRP